MATIPPVTLDHIIDDIVQELIETDDDAVMIADVLIEKMGGYESLRKAFYKKSFQIRSANKAMNDFEIREFALKEFKEFIIEKLNELSG